ncbi:MAG: hypothetical protein DRO88_00815 [Promethearchaeia archaeon]|nr:MAG: hypothetical protein DRO88_00815 [Candidatus Lokiarchaeia archaeon]
MREIQEGNEVKLLERLFQTSQFHEGLKLCQEMLQDQLLSSAVKQKVAIFKLRFLEKLEYYEEGINSAHDLLKTPPVLKNSLYRTDILIELTKLYFSSGQIKLVIRTIQRAEELLYHNKSIETEELEQKMAELVLLRGGYEWQQGELENALFFFKFNLELRRKYNHLLDLAHALNNVGVIYNAIGNLSKALTYLKEAYTEYEKIKSTRGISKTGYNIGAILIQMGELDESLEYMRKSLQIDEKDNYHEGIRVALQNMGEVYWHKGQYDRALELLTKCMSMVEEKDQHFEMSEVYIPLIAIHIEQNNESAAYQCLTKLYRIYFNNPNKVIAQRYWLGKGMFFKYLDTHQSRIKAEYYLTQIIQDEMRYFDITAMAMVELTDLYLEKMKKDSTSKMPSSLSRVLEQMITLALHNHSYSMTAEVLLLKAKLIFLQGEIGHAHELLQKAIRLAEEHDLERIHVKIIQELDEFLEKSAFWQVELITGDQNPNSKISSNQYNTLKEQIKSIFAPDQSGNSASTNLNSLSSLSGINRESIKPECFLLISPQGRVILQTPFHSKWEADSLYFSIFQINLMGFLQDFVAKGIDITSYEGVKLHFFKIKEIIGCFIYQGPLSIAVKKVEELLPRIEEYYPRLTQFKEFEAQQRGFMNLLQQEFYFLITSLSSA